MFLLSVVEVLLEKQLLPKVLSGASAGSLTATMIGTRSARVESAAAREAPSLLSLGNKQMTGPVTSESYRAFLATVNPQSV